MTVIFRALMWVGLAFGMAGTAIAQDKPQFINAEIIAQIDAHIEEAMAESAIPGAAIVLVENGEIVHQRGFGVTRKGGDVSVTPQTPFQLGSVSKSFTAQAVLSLVEDGKVSLDDPVVEYLTEFQMADKAHSDRITIRNVLEHRSGITMFDGNLYQAVEYNEPDALARSVARLKTAKRHAAPGEAFQYSNANYALAAGLLEVVEGDRFENVIEDRVLRPLNMMQSSVRFAKGEDRAIGHRTWAFTNHAFPHDMSRMNLGGAGMVSTAEDMGQYLLATMDEGQKWNRAYSPDAGSGDAFYRFGWFTNDGPPLSAWHSGLNPGFMAGAGLQLETETESSRGYAFMMNQSGTLQGDVALGISDIIKGQPASSFEPPFIRKAQTYLAMVLPVFVVLGIVLTIRRLRRPNLLSSGQGLKCLILPALFVVSSASFIWLVMPKLFGINLSSGYIFQPDLVGAIALTFYGAVIWLALAIFAMRRRTNIGADA